MLAGCCRNGLKEHYLSSKNSVVFISPINYSYMVILNCTEPLWLIVSGCNIYIIDSKIFTIAATLFMISALSNASKQFSNISVCCVDHKAHNTLF